MKECGIMEHIELTVNRCGWWMENREFIWSGLKEELSHRFYIEVQGDGIKE